MRIDVTALPDVKAERIDREQLLSDPLLRLLATGGSSPAKIEAWWPENVSDFDALNDVVKKVVITLYLFRGSLLGGK